jgi:hypothetical protein
MSAAFDSLFAQHAMSSYAKQLALVDIVGENSGWNASLANGTLTFGDKSFAAGILGSFSEDAGSWLWCWANGSMEGLPARVTAVAKRMQELGEANDILELRDPQTKMTDDNCQRLAMVAVGGSGRGRYTAVTMMAALITS